MQFDLATFLLAVAPLLLAITLHEAAHAYAARYWGDNTAEKLGRLTLNPLAHIDLIGTILVPAALLLMQSPFLFGWAKPVPVISRNLRNTRIAWRTIAVAGPWPTLPWPSAGHCCWACSASWSPNPSKNPSTA